MTATGGWLTQQRMAKVKDGGRGEERHGGGRGCGGLSDRRRRIIVATPGIKRLKEDDEQRQMFIVCSPCVVWSLTLKTAELCRS